MERNKSAMSIEDWLGDDNQLGVSIWKKKYQRDNESFEEWLDRVSGGDEQLKTLIFEKKILLGGRTLANRGTNNKASFFNCYSSGFVEDSYVDIMQTAMNIGLTFKSQGGQGISLSKLRPKGTPVGTEYQSDGIVPFMKIFNEVTDGTSQGGCILETELVLTSEGYKPIKDVKVGDMVFTKRGYEKVLTVWDKGVQDVFEVTTDKGYRISTTIDHKFCVDGFQTKPLGSLSVGDEVCLITAPAHECDFDPLAYLLAHYYANGYIPDNEFSGNICTSIKHPGIADKLVECIRAIGFDARTREEDNVIRVIITAQLGRWLTESGLRKKSCYDISIPESIMQGSTSAAVSYIAGAIDSDGNVSGETGVKYSTVSKQYAEQLSLLMKRVGFFPTLSAEYSESPKSTLYCVTDSMRANTIHIIPSIKMMSSDIHCATNSRYSTPYTLNNTGLCESGAKHLNKIAKNTRIGLFTYLSLKDKPYAPMIMDSIKAITPIGAGHVYDIELENEHLFHCNGFYVSNSRKGALMLSVDARHKEAETFIHIKSKEGEIEKANLSLEIDDEFMEAVERFFETGERVVLHEKRNYSGHEVEYDVVPIEVFNALVANCYDWADPAALFTNQFRNYNLMEFDPDYQIETSNPCGT